MALTLFPNATSRATVVDAVGRVKEWLKVCLPDSWSSMCSAAGANNLVRGIHIRIYEDTLSTLAAEGQRDLVARAVIAQAGIPAGVLSSGFTGLDRLGRNAKAFAVAMNKTADMLSWSAGLTDALPTAIAWSIGHAVLPETRLELLLLMGRSAIPKQWINILMTGVLAAQELLPSQQLTTDARTALAAALREQQGRLQEALLYASTTGTNTNPWETAASGGGGGSTSVPGYDSSLLVPPAEPPLNWKPFAALGGSVVLAGLIVWAARSRRGATRATSAHKVLPASH